MLQSVWPIGSPYGEVAVTTGSSDSLSQHSFAGFRNRDSRDKPYKCPVPGCGSAFYQSQNLRRHQNDKHDRQKKFVRYSRPDYSSREPSESAHVSNPVAGSLMEQLVLGNRTQDVDVEGEELGGSGV